MTADYGFSDYSFITWHLIDDYWLMKISQIVHSTSSRDEVGNNFNTRLFSEFRRWRW